MIHEPFPHAVIDDFAPAELCRAAVAEWPAADWPYWFPYDGERGRKFASRDPARLTPACQELARELVRLPVEKLLGLRETFPDLAFYGAGMSQIDAGGELPLHLDCDHHPLTRWRRAASAMLYLTECGGGRLQFWDQGGARISTSFEPRPGRLVIFECTDQAWHSVEPISAGRRLSLSLFFWRLPDGSAAERPRAQFKAPVA